MSNKDDFTLREWAETLPEHFDLSAAYDAEVMPLINQLQEKCSQIGMPIFILAASMQDGVGVQCVETAVMLKGRTPSGMLAAKYAAKMDEDGIEGVMIAAKIRSFAIFMAEQESAEAVKR